ncbi:MAG TPA: gamma-glutamylcyclotransferase family protein [Pyrinomonadaceae bacterium]|nr:gamma-glutamylcyclotransferase family protein [Pyrinomonadaceae bacterium]
MTEETAGTVEVFFYGLFMDESLLRGKGLNPSNRRAASVDDFQLVIGERATLVRREGARAHGVVYTLTRGEVEALYSEESVSAYRSEVLAARFAGARAGQVLCFNLPAPPSGVGRNPLYASKLRALAERLGLPAGYVSSIR